MPPWLSPVIHVGSDHSPAGSVAVTKKLPPRADVVGDHVEGAVLVAQRRGEDAFRALRRGQRHLAGARERVPDLAPVREVAAVEDRDAREIFERAGRQVVVVADAHDRRVRVEARDDRVRVRGHGAARRARGTACTSAAACAAHAGGSRARCAGRARQSTLAGAPSATATATPREFAGRPAARRVRRAATRLRGNNDNKDSGMPARRAHHPDRQHSHRRSTLSATN